MAKTYNPKQVSVIFLGVPLSGYVDGSFITVSRASDTFNKHVGADGEVARSKSADKSGTVTLSLMQTSASNDYLSACQAADELSSLGTGPLLIKDASGRTHVLGAEAWIKKPADVAFSKEVEGREWTFEVAHLEMFIGGN